MLVCLGVVNFVVVDLVVVLMLKFEIEGDMGDMQMGSQVCLMSQVMCKLIVSIGCSNCMVIFINQICMKIGVMFGNFEIMMGGNVLKFYVLVCLDICCIGLIKDCDEVVGNLIKVKVVKNKVVLLFCQVEFDIMYGEGILKVGELIDLGIKVGVVEKLGSWYFYGDECIGQGWENVKQFLCDNFVVVLVIEDKICVSYGLDFGVSDEGDDLLIED